MLILLFGLPGSGKGTQGKILAEAFNMAHASTGDILRELATKNTNYKYLFDEFLNVGKLAPEEIINQAVNQFLSSNVSNLGIILDGYPRTVEQAKYLSSITDKKIIAIFLDAEEQTIYKRISGRFNCVKCGEIYNIHFKALKKANTCDKCNSKEFNFRIDDTKEVISKRIETYVKFTLPVINYYKEKKTLFTLNGNDDIEKLQIEMDNLLKMN